jgi:hypothetical protein
MSNTELLTYNKIKEYLLSDRNTLTILKNINKITQLPINEELTDKYIKLQKKIDITKLIYLYRNDIDKINIHLTDLFITIYIKKDYPNVREVLYREIRNNTTTIMDDDSNNFNRLRIRDDPNLTNTGVASDNKESFNNTVNINGIPRFNYNHIEYNTITLSVDTRYQNVSNTDLTRFDFNITNNMKKKYPRSGNITALGNITNIVKFEICGFTIPYKPIIDNKFKQVTLRLNDFTSDCIEHYEFVHHWKFTMKYIEEDNRISLEPCEKVYEFRKPITEINNFSLTFGNPFVPIKFDKDRMLTTNIDYTTNPAIFTFGEDHNLSTGDNIIISDFTSLNPAEDFTILEEINSLEGHSITQVSCNQICVNGIDLTRILNPDSNLVVEIYFNSKRIYCNIKVTYIINDST